MKDIEQRALAHNAQFRDWICDERRMALTDDALYLHCLPADIGDEVSPEVMDRFRVAVAREAEQEGLRGDGLLAAAKVPDLADKLGGDPMTLRHSTAATVSTRTLDRESPRSPSGTCRWRWSILEKAIRIPPTTWTEPATPAATRGPVCRTTSERGCTFLRDTIVECRAVRHADDVWFDDYGNLVWVVSDPFDGVAPEHRAE